MWSPIEWRQAEKETAARLYLGSSVFSRIGVLSRPQTMDADHSKSPEGLLGVLGHMLSGKSLDLLLAAAAATGKLKSFARKFIK